MGGRRRLHPQRAEGISPVAQNFVLPENAPAVSLRGQAIAGDISRGHSCPCPIPCSPPLRPHRLQRGLCSVVIACQGIGGIFAYFKAPAATEGQRQDRGFATLPGKRRIHLSGVRPK